MLIAKINPIVVNDLVTVVADVFELREEYPSHRKTEVPYDLTGKRVTLTIETLNGKEIFTGEAELENNQARVSFQIPELGEMKGEMQIEDNDVIYTIVRFYFTVVKEIVLQ